MNNLPEGPAEDRKGAKTHSDSHRSKFWTLMVIREPGSIFSFRVGRPLIAIFICLALAALAFSVVSLVSYNVVSTENEKLKEDLDRLRSELAASNRAKERALVRLMAFEGQDKGVKKGEGLPAATTQPSPASTDTKAPSDPVASQIIAIEQLEIWKDIKSGSVKFQFMLKNIDLQGTKIRGYTFVVLTPLKVSEGPITVSPRTALKDGRPTNYRNGQFFSIARIKSVRGFFPGIETTERFKAATIFVFSDTGSLLFEKQYELAGILRS
ncbi:MAG: hypothetical protein SV775_19685 [Thermodesulfobacteriota bacterium]|nr:hypothetical protein [Thermodesulfobacteriota bacterium]